MRAREKLGRAKKKKNELGLRMEGRGLGRERRNESL